MTPAAIVSKLLPALRAQTSWNYCNVLRDDGMSDLSACGHAQAGGDYDPARISCAGKDQLTYLLFLKMADERTKPPYVPASGAPAQNMQAGAHKQPATVPEAYSWPTLVKKDGDELFDHYRHTLENLGNEKGLLGLIFNKSQNKFQDPAKLLCTDRLRQSILKQAFSGKLSSSGELA